MQHIETDEQIITRVRERFEALDDMTNAIAQGNVRAMVVFGAPGVGKSFGVLKVLSKYDSFHQLTNETHFKRYEVVKGTISALGLYAKLYTYSDPKNVLVFDDCDVWDDEDAVNILKAALDSSERRFIQYNKDSRLLKENGIPFKFEYKGGAILITNVDFDNVRSKKMRSHLAALSSRCHHIDLTIDTEREVILRIRQLINDGMLDEHNFAPETVQSILDFIDENRFRLKELSLRTVVKAAELINSFGAENWQRYGKLTLLKS